jgi:hypothetical protein
VSAACFHIFQTTRLILRPIASADARPIFDGYAQYPDVTRFLTWRPHTRIEQTETYVARIEVDSARTYVLTERNNWKLIGAFDLRNSGRFRLGYGYVLAQSSWGGRHAEFGTASRLKPAGKHAPNRHPVTLESGSGSRCDPAPLPIAPKADHVGELLDRLGRVREIGLPPDISERVAAERQRQFVREGYAADAHQLGRYTTHRRPAILVATATDLESRLTDPVEQD